MCNLPVSNVPVLAMTATANNSEREDINKSLGLKNCFEIVGNPDRRNVMYEKHFRAGWDIDYLMDILSPIAQGLLEEQIDYPLTINQLCSPQCTIRVALGMGVDIRSIRRIVHITPPHSIQAYFQKTSRAGRDGNRHLQFFFIITGTDINITFIRKQI